MSNEHHNLSQIGEAILQKFVNEEIMTKSELELKLDNVMSKYVAHIDRKFDNMERQVEHIDQRLNLLQTDMDKRFEQVDKRFEQVDIKYRWIIGLVVTATLSILGTIIKLH